MKHEDEETGKTTTPEPVQQAIGLLGTYGGRDNKELIQKLQTVPFTIELLQLFRQSCENVPPPTEWNERSAFDILVADVTYDLFMLTLTPNE